MDIASVHNVEVANSPVDTVTVYNDRAEVTRRVEVELPSEGNHEIVIQGLSSMADKNSVRVSGGSGNATILEVSVSSKWISSSSSDNQGKAQTLDSTKKQHEAEVKKVQEALERLNKESKFVQAWADKAMQLGHTFNADDKVASDFLSEGALTDLSRFLEYYQKQLLNIDTQRSTLSKQLEELQQKITDVNREIQSLNQPNSRERTDVTVSLHSAEKAKVVLQYSYIVRGCSWTPSYDIRVTTSTNSLQLQYYGNIVNSTGEDWKNVQLQLSTAQPSAGGSPPKLPGSVVQYYVAPVIATPYYEEERIAVQSVSFARSLSEKESSRRPSAAPAKPVQVLTATAAQGASSVTYTIPRLATVNSDNKPRKVTITLLEDLKPRFTYVAVPSKTDKVYLKVSAQNTTSSFQFLAGSLNVFMDNNFVCTSSFNTVNPGEEFALYLGADAGVRVEYVSNTSLENAGFMGKTKTQHYVNVITLKNSKTVDVAVTTFAQLPLSRDDSIKVKLLKPNLKDTKDDIKLNTQNNLEWRYVIPAGGKLEIPFSYDVEFPKDKEIDVVEN